MKTIPATVELVPMLIARMTDADLAELDVLTQGRSIAHLNGLVRRSKLTWCGVDDGGVVNMGGVLPLGYVWQIVTTALVRHKRAYLEQSQTMMDLGLAMFPSMRTFIKADYAAALRHVRRHGWTVGAPMDRAGTLACLCERTR